MMMKRKKVKMKTLISFITKKFIKSIKLEKIKEKKNLIQEKNLQVPKRIRKSWWKHGVKVKVMKTPWKKNAQMRMPTCASWLWRNMKIK